MNRALKIVLTLALLAAAGAAGLYLWHRSNPPVLPVARVEAPPPPPSAPAGPRHRLAPATAPEKPLPTLAASDPDVREALGATMGAAALERLVLEDFIRRVVATIDNLPREQYAARLSPVKPVPELPRTTGKGDTLALAPENAARYAPAMAALDTVDAARLADFYLRYYPLFQQAYVDLGYPQGYFNDRLVEVIDHLLATPEVSGPILLVQPKVLYEFADEELERRSAGQKALIRIGSANAARVKAKLREIRSRVARAQP